jgi:hemerythrin-like domain-containing protein
VLREAAMKNNVLDLVYRTHTEGKEKSVFMKEFILKHDKDNFVGDIRDTMEFFYAHIPVHFAYEEVVIHALTSNKILSDEETSNFEKIIEEHSALKNKFKNIKGLSDIILKSGAEGGAKVEYLQAVMKTIIALIAHAEFEDVYFYPVAEQKLPDEVLSQLEQEMKKIVC